ncbi:hypothetical protein [Allomesorhizobium alhagi]|uniref:Uncharacterized protein n=1 Tax=Mesorhizobium alhagi CCNWXJ12-2 TaxID=1107882 RepID=H0HUP8_9HYPH|nr:hypothetical protein [Mesorhizobium alhagi]EHK55538.1 hypothetical protein MAXJ12_19248 [Mesorhizobium alhagi CCNWXJ12-2]
MRALDASRWLALSMAILIAISALLHDGHAPAAAAEDIRFAIENTHAEPAAEHSHAKPCGGEEQARDDGSCCISTSGCAICVPGFAQALDGSTRSTPLALASDTISLPGDCPLQMRPPKVSAIA